MLTAASTALAASPASPSNWQPMTLSTSFWRDITSPDGVHLWMCGSTGDVATSTDGGVTWAEKNVGSFGVNSTCIEFTDTQHGWVSGSRFVQVTSDGGETWADSTAPLTGDDDFYNNAYVDFVDTEHGWVWDNTLCSATTDSGQTWSSRTMPVNPREVQFIDESHGWALSGSWVSYDHSSDVSKTTDGGMTWSSMLNDGTTGYGRLAFADALHGWVTNGEKLLHTTDGGDNWTLVASSYDIGDTQEMCAADATHLWRADRLFGNLYGSDDAGTTWFLQYHSSYSPSGAAILIRGEKGWMCGGGVNVRTELNGAADMRPPVTMITGPPFIKTTTTYDFAATDIGTGVTEVWYKWDDGAWTQGTSLTVDVPADAGHDPIHHLYVSSRDAYGNWEVPTDTVIGFDVIGPDTGLSPRKTIMLNHWINRASYVTISSYDELSGLEKLMVRHDGGAWRQRQNDYLCVTAAPKTHRNDGAHLIAARGIDVLGNVGATVRGKVMIDTRRPTAKAPYVAHAKPGGAGSIKCEIVDKRPCSGACAVQIRVYNQSGKLVGIIAPQVWFKSNRLLTISFKCPLKVGTYRFTVKGGDGAGNVSGLARNTLIVGNGSAAAADALLPTPGAVDWLAAGAASGCLLNGHVAAP